MFIPTRRDFLKLAGLLPAGFALSNLGRCFRRRASQTSSCFLFDAMSARNLSLYGYRRETTPNLARFAQRATLYHSHYAAGVLPHPVRLRSSRVCTRRKHRAINMRAPVRRDLANRTSLPCLGRTQRIAYTQNLFAEVFLRQFRAHVDPAHPADGFWAARYPAHVQRTLRLRSVDQWPPMPLTPPRTPARCLPAS